MVYFRIIKSIDEAMALISGLIDFCQHERRYFDLVYSNNSLLASGLSDDMKRKHYSHRRD
jgi:hypothetical protein